jgi:hypothetical protein
VYRVTIHLGADNRTGKVDHPALEEFVAEHWEGATITPARGLWQGHWEDAAVITLYTDAGSEAVDAFCEQLRLRFGQDEIYAVVEEL